MRKTYTHLFAYKCVFGEYWSRKKTFGIFSSTPKSLSFYIFYHFLENVTTLLPIISTYITDKKAF